LAKYLTNRLFSSGLLAALSASALVAQNLPLQAPSSTDAVAETVQNEDTVPQPRKRPAEMSPKPPKVTCQGNQLTIAAENSTLASVLAAVHLCIGAEIEVPSGSAETRTYIALGPGPTRDVLDALLSSTELDFVIQSSNIAPEKIQTVLLMARTKDTKDSKGPVPPAGLLMTPARRAWMASRNSGRPAATPADDTDSTPSGPEPALAAEKIVADKPVPDKVESAANDSGNPVGTPSSADSNASNAPSSPPKADEAPADSISKLPITPTSVPAQDNATATGANIAATEPASGSDTSSQTPAAKELQNRISDMQNLFEQRKKMNATQSPSTPQN